MKFLILGGTGMAGHVIALYLKEKGHNVISFSTKGFEYCESIIGDAQDKEALTKVLVKNNYDVVVNCIGILNETCEKEKSKAIYLNSFLPHFISEVLQNTKTKFVHMSTDCVFSGQKGSYNENDFKDGETFYDRTKALGEMNNNYDLVFRNSIIGPDYNENGIGLFNWFMKQKSVISGYNKAIWTGVSTITLAKAMEEAVIQNISGIYNLVNNKTINKFELLSLFNKHMKNEKIKIVPNDAIRVDKSLVNNRRDFEFEVPSYEQMVIEMKEWIIKHPDIYPHYDINIF